MCPFKAGELVIYKPSDAGRGKSIMTDLADLRPGARYRVVRVDRDCVVLEGFESSPTGGLYWREFERVD